MAQLTLKPNPSLSAQFIPQVSLTAPFTLLQETTALLNAPFTQTEPMLWQTAPSTQRVVKTAQTVLSTPQGSLRTAPSIPQGLATMLAPCMGKGPSQSPPQTAHFTPQGFKSVSVPQNQTPKRRRVRQGTIGLGTRQEETA